MVFTKKKEQPEDSTFAKLNESSGSFDFEMDDRTLVRGRETSDGTTRSPAQEKRRSRSRSAVRKLANVFSSGNKQSAASEDRLHGERAMDDEQDKSGSFVPPPSFGGLSPSKSNGAETEETAEDIDNSDKASNNGSISGAQTFEMQEMPIKSPKGRRRWRSRSRTRTPLDQKLESDSGEEKQVNDDDDEASHHGSVVASVVSMFEYISPRRGQAKKLSCESPAKLMESPTSPKTKKSIRSWIPKSPGRRAKEAAAEEAQKKVEEETEDQLRSSFLAAPSKANLDITLNLMDDEKTSGGGELTPSSSPRRASQNRSARQSVMHRRRGSRGPERRRSSHEQTEDQDIEHVELEDLDSSQVSLIETGSVLTATDTVVTTVTSCSEVVALPPHAKGSKSSRHAEDPPESGQRRRVIPDPSCESLQSILKANKYSSGAGNNELKEPKSPKSPRSPGIVKSSRKEVSRSLSKSEHGTRSSSRSTDVSTAKRSRSRARSSAKAEQGEEVRRRGRSRRPSEGGARRSSTASAHAPVKSPKPEGRRKSMGSRLDNDSPSHSSPLRSSRHSNARPSSRGRVRPSGHGGRAVSPSDGHRIREPSSSRTSQGRHSLHARRPSRTPNGRRKSLAGTEGRNLHAAPLVPELNKELSKEVKREIMDDMKNRGHEEGVKMPTHSRHRSKSRHRRSSSKGSRKKAESSHGGDGHKVKVRVVKKHRAKEHDNEAAQLQIEDVNESILDVEFNPVTEVSS